MAGQRKNWENYLTNYRTRNFAWMSPIARQLDTSLRLLWEICCSFGDRIREVHISELDSFCRHQPMSNGAVRDYQRVAAVLTVMPRSLSSRCSESNRAPFAWRRLLSRKRL